jgi:hypothetical protein
MGTLLYLGGRIHMTLVSAVFCIWIEMAIMISAALFFSTITSPVLAAIFSITLYVAGHLNDLISIQYVSKSQSFYSMILKILYYLLPNLQHFNLRDHVVYNAALPNGFVLLAGFYGALYITLFLFLSCVIFHHKDL